MLNLDHIQSPDSIEQVLACDLELTALSEFFFLGLWTKINNQQPLSPTRNDLVGLRLGMSWWIPLLRSFCTDLVHRRPALSLLTDRRIGSNESVRIWAILKCSDSNQSSLFFEFERANQIVRIRTILKISSDSNVLRIRMIFEFDRLLEFEGSFFGD